ncbi:MAG: metal ABC transporter substrate-binding protein, partial [Gammaproteobacteria bacterium]|nr:metal ABC transporter substrate-binding protein [Gammaproteobacteria bacterium]
TVADIAKVSSSDLFIYVGGESDEWVEDALKSAVNKDMVTINLLETLGDKAKEEELIEGMEGEDHDHDHEEGEDHDHDHEHEEGEAEYDEHVWLSLKNAQIFVSKIKDAMVSIDKANAKTYEDNAKKYNDELKALDAKYADAVSKATIKTLLFGDRFPFRYLVDDYDLKYYAAFIGCSSETEASFETIVFLSNKVNELGLKVIIKIESSDGSIANTIKNNTTSKNQKILTLDSLQSSTLAEHKKGNTYLKIMTDNLEVLKEALS